jgi:hypothetical protein
MLDVAEEFLGLLGGEDVMKRLANPILARGVEE